MLSHLSAPTTDKHQPEYKTQIPFSFLKRWGVLGGRKNLFSFNQEKSFSAPLKKSTLLNFNARVNESVEEVGGEIENDKQNCAEKDESFEELEVGIIEGVNTG